MRTAWKILLLSCLASGSALAQRSDADNDGLPDDWEINYSLSPSNSANALADADGDGLINLLEYAFGGDPRTIDPGVRPIGNFTDAFSITFNRRLDTRLSIVAEQTESLLNPSWTTNGLVLLSRQAIGPDLERVTYRMTPSVPEKSSQFFRVAVRLLPKAGTLPEFSYRVIDDTIAHGQGTSIVDIDQDGDMDVIAALSLTDAVYLYLNGGNSSGGGRGTNWSTIPIAPGNSIVAMQTAVADFDNDGDLDVAAVGLFDRSCVFCAPGSLVWYEHPGNITGAWTAHVIDSNIWGARFVAAGDLTGDGLPDLIVSANEINGNGNGLFWFRNGNNGASWSGKLTLDAGLRQVEMIRIADINGDGVPDVVAVGKNSNEIAWYENGRAAGTRDDNPAFTKHVIGTPQLPDSFFLVNLDADGASELIVSSAEGIAIYDSPADPRQPWTRTVLDAGFGMGNNARLFAADFDGDGLADLAAGSNLTGELRWYQNSGTQWTARTIRAGYTGLTEVIGADLNQDGRVDLVTTTYNYDPNNNTDRVAWWANLTSISANRPPVLNPIGNRSVQAGSALSFTVTASDPDADTLQFSLGPGAPPGAGIGPQNGLFAWTPPPAQAPGVYPLTIVVSDGASNDSETIDITVLPLTAGGSSVLFQTTLDDLAAIASPRAGLGGTTTLSAGDFVPGQTNNAANFSAQPTGKVARFPAATGAGQNLELDKGEIEFWFRPNYSGNGDDLQHVLLVAGDIYNAPRIEIVESDRLSFSLIDRNFNFYTAQGEYHQPLFQAGEWVRLRAVWDNSEAADSVRLFVNGQRVDAGGVPGNWTLGEEPALGEIFVGAADGTAAFSADALMDELIIRGSAPVAANHRPTLNAIGPRTVSQGETLSFTVSATDADGDSLLFSLGPGAPEGALIGPATGAFAWTPGANLAPGSYAVTIQVTDNGTPSLTQAETIQIMVQARIGPQACPDGPALAGALGGDIGPAPDGDFAEITCLEIRNDQASERSELAWSGIPLPRELNLLDPQSLAVIGPGNRWLAAQFNVLSRWGGPRDRVDLPIRWLQVAVPARVLPGGRSYYSLRRYTTPPLFSDPMAASVRTVDNRVVVETGLATFTLDPANPALFDQMAIDEDNDGTGRTTVYSHSPGSGPRLVFLNNGAEVTLSTAAPNQARVDDNGFSIVETGPARVVVELKGHFSDPAGRSLFTAGNLAYERFGYTLIATFQRASRDVLLEFHFRNESSDAMFPPWTDDVVTVREVSFALPFSFNGDRSVFVAGQGAVTGIAAASVQVEQRKGGGNPWTRRARILVDGAETETGVMFADPFLAIADARYAVAAQLPWMRYREPQAIVAASTTLLLKFISEDQIVGEAKGIWNQARISIQPAGGRTPAEILQALEQLRAKGRLEMERGLLVRAPLDFVNSSGVFASLGNSSGSAIKTAYVETINAVHDQTVRPGGQWDRAKTFGSQLWPDIQRDLYAIDNATPADDNAAMNYWNPSGAELLEFLRTGDPKWVWDFALPQSWLQVHTAYLNIGDHTQGNRNGLAVTSGGTGDGQWHRSGFGSDDYTYNVGLGLAYALRPGAAFRDRFAQAGGTVIRRYDIPKANEAEREEFVNQITISRQAIQHYEMLANAAEFVPGVAGSAAHEKLMEIVSELAQDNLRAGVMAEGDLPPLTTLSEPQQFMQTAMMYPFFHRFYRNYGDVGNGLIRRALTQGPLDLYRFGMEKGPDGTSILVTGGWASRMECALSAGGTQVDNCTRGLDSDGNRNMYEFNKPHTVALLLMAHDLDPGVGLCAVAKQAYDNPAMTRMWDSNLANDAGWWKGSAQMMQSMIFGVGLYDTCRP